MSIDTVIQPHNKQRQAIFYTGMCRGSLGELFQGPSLNHSNEIAVISSLIPSYSWAYFTPSNDRNDTLLQQAQLHPERQKAFKGLSLYCHDKQVSWPSGHWHFNSDLQVGRGMASSTADIVAVLRCASNTLEQPLHVDDITKVLSQIERSDSVFLDQMSIFSSSAHQVIRTFNSTPPLYALYMHEDNTVETEGTKSILTDYYRDNFACYRTLYLQAESAFAKADAKRICYASSRSAELSQAILPKQHYGTLLKSKAECMADGIITAHTGSIIGYLYCQKPRLSLVEKVSNFFRELGGLCRYTEVSA